MKRRKRKRERGRDSPFALMAAMVVITMPAAMMMMTRTISQWFPRAWFDEEGSPLNPNARLLVSASKEEYLSRRLSLGVASFDAVWCRCRSLWYYLSPKIKSLVVSWFFLAADVQVIIVVVVTHRSLERNVGWRLNPRWRWRVSWGGTDVSRDKTSYDITKRFGLKKRKGGG